MRDREGDDLTGVGRVGDDLLVPRQHRVEHDLTAGHAVGRCGTDGLTLEDLTVSQHQGRFGRAMPTVPMRFAGGFAQRRASPSTTTGSPARMV